MMTTNRIIMNPSLTGRPLVVSRPGYDALTASGPDELAFDSNWLEANQILYEGTASAQNTYVNMNINDIGGRYFLLVAFPSPGFVPLALVFRPTYGWITDSSRFLLCRHNAIYVGGPSLSDSGTIRNVESKPTGSFRYIITNVAIDE